ncbi:hypothetical protein ACFE04_026730 [Oxalis oulophora]
MDNNNKQSMKQLEKEEEVIIDLLSSSSSMEKDSPIRSIFCLKAKIDNMEPIDEVEDWNNLGPTPVVEEEAVTSPAKDVSDRGEDVIVDGFEPIVRDVIARLRRRGRHKHRWTHHRDDDDVDWRDSTWGEDPTWIDTRNEFRHLWFGVFGALRWCSEGTTPRSTSGVKSSLSWIRHYRQIYSSKLLQALNQVRSSNAQPQQQRRSVREAADTALAVAAKGRTCGADLF